MKNIGIIAEYNPFHNGHKYQIERAREILNPDSITIAMSQDILQRGEFASFDKWWRTEKALQAGANLVLGLPFYISSQSAEFFAKGALQTLSHAGVTHLVFGAESNDLSTLKKIANHLVNHETELMDLVKGSLKDGLNFPTARAKALEDMGVNATLINSPNNILAVEYLKAIIKNNYSITPVLIPRTGSNYHDLKLSENFSSASAIRDNLSKSGAGFETNVPYSIKELYEHFSQIDEEAFFKSMMILLMNSDENSLEQIVGVNHDRSRQLLRLPDKAININDIFSELKSKNITQTALNRMFMNLILGFKKEDLTLLNSDHFNPYLRILGFDSRGRTLLKNIKELKITNVAKAIKKLDKTQKLAFELDLKASRLRSLFLNTKEYYNSDYFNKPIMLADSPAKK